MRYSRQLLMMGKVDAWRFYRDYGVDMTLDGFHGMWWRLTLGGEC
jgi:hypothetical protein